jgi:hypothetical protein
VAARPLARGGAKIDTMNRKKPQDYVVGEPAVFPPVVGGPEFEAECQELEEFKVTADEPFMYDVLRLRKMRKEGEGSDQKHYGDRYPEILRIRAAIQSDVFEWIKPMAQAPVFENLLFSDAIGEETACNFNLHTGKERSSREL